MLSKNPTLSHATQLRKFTETLQNLRLSTVQLMSSVASERSPEKIKELINVKTLHLTPNAVQKAIARELKRRADVANAAEEKAAATEERKAPPMHSAVSIDTPYFQAMKVWVASLPIGTIQLMGFDRKEFDRQLAIFHEQHKRPLYHEPEPTLFRLMADRLDALETASELRTPINASRQIHESGAVRKRDVLNYSDIPPCAIRREAQIYNEGELEYGRYNWKAGLPHTSTLDHMMNHLVLYMLGDRSEDHMAKVRWGTGVIMYFDEAMPEMNDLKW